MAELAKWTWIILILILFGGFTGIYIICIFAPLILLALFLIDKYRPEWLAFDSKERNRIRKERIEKELKKRSYSELRQMEKPEYSTVVTDDSYPKKIKVIWLKVNFHDDSFEDDDMLIHFKMTENMKGLTLFIKSKTDRIRMIKWQGARLEGESVIIDEFENGRPSAEEIYMNDSMTRTLRVLKGKTYTRLLINIGDLGYKDYKLSLRLPVVCQDESEKYLDILLTPEFYEYEE